MGVSAILREAEEERLSFQSRLLYLLLFSEHLRSQGKPYHLQRNSFLSKILPLSHGFAK